MADIDATVAEVAAAPDWNDRVALIRRVWNPRDGVPESVATIYLTGTLCVATF